MAASRAARRKKRAVSIGDLIANPADPRKQIDARACQFRSSQAPGDVL